MLCFNTVLTFPNRAKSILPGSSRELSNLRRGVCLLARGAGVEPAGLSPWFWRPHDSPVTPAQIAGLFPAVILKNQH